MAVPVLLFAIAVGVRAASSFLFVDAAYPDAYYYASVARALAAGRGFEIDYVWNFVDVGGVLPTTGVLPIPSNGHWMPLAALVQVPFIWLLGTTSLAAALPFWIATGLTASLTWFIGRDAGLADWQSAAAGILVGLPGGLAPFLSQPDNFALFMLLGALALWLCGRGMRGDRRAFAVGGLVVGLAFLARTDGVLLGVPFVVAAGEDLVRSPRGSRIGARAMLLFVAGFAVLAIPWVLRQIDVFGSISPSAANGRILWITEYAQLYSVSSETTLESFLRQGPASIAWSRLGGLAFAVVLFAALPLLLVLVPFLVIGSLARWRDPNVAPWLLYAVVLFGFTALVSAVHVPYGTFMHSAVALVPHAYLVSLVGVGLAVAWVGRRRASWDVPRAIRTIGVMLVAIVLLGGVGATFVTTRAWEMERAGRAPLLAALAAAARPGDRVMSADAGAFHHHGGWPGIVTPEDPLPVVEEALRRYGIRWLALESSHIVRSLAPVLSGRVRPDWLSEPYLLLPGGWAIDGSGGEESSGPSGALRDEAGSAIGASVPRAALFAVCLEADDARCDR